MATFCLVLLAIAGCGQKPGEMQNSPVKKKDSAVISLKTVLQPVNSAVITTVPAVLPEQKTLPIVIRADGYLDFDTRTFNNIAARFPGRIEKLYVKYAFQPIHRGERVFDIYSPEMVSAQQDLVFLSKSGKADENMLQAARQKLLLLGMTASQVSEVIQTGKAFYSLPVYSPYEGHVHDMPHSQMPGSDDPKPVDDYATNIPLSIREGSYVQRGQTVFNVVDPHRLWAILKITASDAGKVRLNQPVTISLPDLPGKTLIGHVNFIEPLLENGDKTTSIRVYLDNMNHALKVNSLVQAAIQAGTRTGLWIPRTAVLDLGTTRIVWVKESGLFKARPVQTGLSLDKNILITRGLTPADSLASNAQYLTDSEGFIKTQ
ncbi:efflux RND transporter periplasmic adaptor subunit [Mucilaginibacter sabulilitoris]|uniref:Efflux RND transporter periplasmic adaptor subunit n=1 Tax=Mucilaginibacter sabulilitoris TaxID=1173583 RepID=A0ABZ0TNE6_9SPHI|nr:efflux RND transporter periplasmic adaptor subunit [Mucilaginibacter sabulilitoris]WPU94676.1 efflux RND transporter periplasmic adaptor subunit [Mucilaginibacter sabulilitoris]